MTTTPIKNEACKRVTKIIKSRNKRLSDNKVNSDKHAYSDKNYDFGVTTGLPIKNEMEVDLHDESLLKNSVKQTTLPGERNKPRQLEKNYTTQFRCNVLQRHTNDESDQMVQLRNNHALKVKAESDNYRSTVDYQFIFNDAFQNHNDIEQSFNNKNPSIDGDSLASHSDVYPPACNSSIRTGNSDALISDFYARHSAQSFSASPIFHTTMIQLFGYPDYANPPPIENISQKDVQSTTSVTGAASSFLKLRKPNLAATERSGTKPDRKTIENAKRAWRVLRQYVQEEFISKRTSQAALSVYVKTYAKRLVCNIYAICSFVLYQTRSL